MRTCNNIAQTYTNSTFVFDCTTEVSICNLAVTWNLNLTWATVSGLAITNSTFNNTTLTGNTTIGSCAPATTTTIRGNVDFQCWDIDFSGTTVDFTWATVTGIGWGGPTYSDEQAQDAVGTILVDTNTINLTYTDATPSITADVVINNLISTDAGNDLVLGGDGKLYINDTTGGSTIPDLSGAGSFIAGSWASPFTFTASADGWVRISWLNVSWTSYGVLYEDTWTQLIYVKTVQANSNWSGFSGPYGFQNDAPSDIVPVKAGKDYYYRNLAGTIIWAHFY